MGQHADDIINGDVDEQTGEWIGNGQGFPRTFNQQNKKEKTSLANPTLKAIEKILIDNDYTITQIRHIDYGYQLRTLTGAVINIYSSGKFIMQGKPDEKLKALLK